MGGDCPVGDACINQNVMVCVIHGLVDTWLVYVQDLECFICFPILVLVMSFGYMYRMRINIHSTFYVETPGVKNARNVSQFEGYISKMSKRERICSHHKLNVGNAFVAVRRNIPDRRSHRVHELLQNEDLNLMWIIWWWIQKIIVLQT